MHSPEIRQLASTLIRTIHTPDGFETLGSSGHSLPKATPPDIAPKSAVPPWQDEMQGDILTQGD
jgi:hypothetical protein